MFETSLFGQRVPLKHLVPFLRQAGTMLRAGIGIRQVLDTLAAGTSNRRLQEAIGRMSERVEAGDSLEEALRAAGPVFPEMMVRVLVVGETAGGLDRMFRELADYFEWWRMTLRRLLGQLVYPLFMLAALAHVLALVRYFGALEGDPRVPLLLFYLGVPAVLFAPKVMRLLVGHSLLFDALVLKVPLVGKHIRTLLLARFSLALELLMDAGVGIDEALERAAQSTGNEAFVRGIRPAVERVLEGDSFTESLARTGMFPRTFLARMQTAEESGALVEDLHRLAQDSAEEARFAIGALTVAAAWVVYAVIGLVLIYYILLLGSRYAGMINTLAGGG